MSRAAGRTDDFVKETISHFNKVLFRVKRRRTACPNRLLDRGNFDRTVIVVLTKRNVDHRNGVAVRVFNIKPAFPQTQLLFQGSRKVLAHPTDVVVHRVDRLIANLTERRVRTRTPR